MLLIIGLIIWFVVILFDVARSSNITWTNRTNPNNKTPFYYDANGQCHQKSDNKKVYYTRDGRDIVYKDSSNCQEVFRMNAEEYKKKYYSDNK